MTKGCRRKIQRKASLDSRKQYVTGNRKSSGVFDVKCFLVLVLAKVSYIIIFFILQNTFSRYQIINNYGEMRVRVVDTMVFCTYYTIKWQSPIVESLKLEINFFSKQSGIQFYFLFVRYVIKVGVQHQYIFKFYT